MRTWDFKIIPRRHNEIHGYHWGRRHRERLDWGLAFKSIPLGPWHEDSPPIAGFPVKVRILVYRPKKLQDPTNAKASVKHLEDALVRRGWAVDDTNEWIDLEVRERIGRPARTRIRWEVTIC